MSWVELFGVTLALVLLGCAALIAVIFAKLGHRAEEVLIWLGIGFIGAAMMATVTIGLRDSAEPLPGIHESRPALEKQPPHPAQDTERLLPKARL